MIQPRLSLVVLVACDITAVTVRAKFAYVAAVLTGVARGSGGDLNSRCSRSTWQHINSAAVYCPRQTLKVSPELHPSLVITWSASARAGANQVVRHTRVCLSGGDESTAPITDLTLSGNTQQPVMQ
ncbi:hypothetical protein RRG08_063809 [Elysia crispata]|uniref:Secreted protein n=1 Tax=Elysia crispata TaxID=231223 RepID=A0AAE0ZKU1_9GAST|nr:hypothetical protein RRG08_063809 [Elysia crispata]